MDAAAPPVLSHTRLASWESKAGGGGERRGVHAEARTEPILSPGFLTRALISLIFLRFIAMGRERNLHGWVSYSKAFSDHEAIGSPVCYCSLGGRGGVASCHKIDDLGCMFSSSCFWVASIKETHIKQLAES